MINYAFYFEGLSLVVDVKSASTRNAALAHTASNNCSVRSHTTASGKDTFSSRHTSQVFGRCFDADHNYTVTVVVPCLCIIGVEYDLTACSTWRCRKTLSDNLSLLQCVLVEYWVKKFIELLWFATQDCSLFVDKTFLQEVHSNLHHCSTCALAITSLQEPKFTFLNGELHILHIVVVVFELILDSIEFLVDFWHSFFHRRIFACAFFFRNALKSSPTA